MDALDRVREIGADAELTEEQLASALQKVRRGLLPDPAPRRRARLWIGIGGLVAAGAATTAVAIALSAPPAAVVEAVTPPPAAPDVTVTTEPEPEPTTTPTPAPTMPPVTAASVLEGAAALATTSAGSAIADDGYLRIDHRTEQLVLYAADAPNSPYNASRESATAAWVVAGTYSTFIPADRSGEWVRVFQPEKQLLSLYGTDAEPLAADWLGMTLKEVIVNRYQGGLGDPGDETYPTYGSDAYFAQMPRDPQALIDWNRARLSAGNVQDLDEGVVTVLTQDLELNAAPPDLRAAMFRALALAPGVEIQSVDGDLTTIAFHYDSYEPRMGTMTIDTRTGLVAESTSTWLPGPGIVPESVPGHRMTTTITVVDSAP
ncbi:hypothetical protein ACPW96_04495 [Micromonospora sp. DT81.3]|uniref:hypothetical protein n=1 Tax=Micromonospora sp. DT81.3 TaxID=3416523 RepID=UPI003CF51154